MTTLRPSPSATYAFRIGYLADGFQGYARQPGASTVEGTLREGLLRRRIVSPEEEGRFRTASRTDRGVLSLGNVVSFPTRLSGERAARALGSIDPRILCFGYAEVERDFQPRHARERFYRYLLPGAGRRLSVWREGAVLFEGEHDLSSFSRRDDPPRSSRGSVASFRVEARDGHLQLDVRARSFLWNQVRKMVAALELLDAGKLSLKDLALSLAGGKVLHLPLAPADGLVLMEVSYGFPFTPLPRDGGAQRRRFLAEELRRARTKETLLGWFQARALEGAAERSEP